MDHRRYFLFFLIYGQALSWWSCMAQSFCEDAQSILFILEKNPQDSTTFLAQIDFAQSLTERFVGDDTNLNLFIFHKKTTEEFIFHVVFQNTTKWMIMQEKENLFFAKGNKLLKAKSASDLFHHINDKPSRCAYSSIVVAMNVQLSLSFYLMGGDHTLPEDAASQFWDVCFKTYVIYINEKHESKFNRKTYKRKKRPFVDEIITFKFKDSQSFYNSFEEMFDELCLYKNVLMDLLGLIRPMPAQLVDTLGCNISNCSLSLEFVRDQSIVVTATFLQYKWAFSLNPRLQALPLTKNQLSQVGFTFREAERTCSRYQMSLLTIRGKKESDSYRKYLSAIYLALSALNEGNTVKFMIGLKRKRTGSRRFAWNNDKALSFSHWGEQEPSGGDAFKCAVWKWKMNAMNMEDYGWGSSTCGKKGTEETVLCHVELYPKEMALEIYMDSQSGIEDNARTQNIGELYTCDNHESYILISMSLAISSGFLKKKMTENCVYQLKNLVYDEVITRPAADKELLTELERLFYKCNDGDLPLGVPYSQVCDGVRDCSSGSDEFNCEQFGYPSCSFQEFTCGSGQCIPLQEKCDLLLDCKDGSDEKDCYGCQHRLCTNGRCLPKPWFHDGQVDCSDGSDEHVPNANPCIFYCNRTQCVTRRMLNDSVVDCQGPEGPIDETLGRLESVNCTKNGSSTFTNNWAPKCVLVLDDMGEIIGCRDHQHLSNCEDFRCPQGYAKCPLSFCIPLGYLNDGKQDCDEGQDEGPQSTQTSLKLFKCHPYSQQYVPRWAVCDGKQDCSRGEDELDCHYTCSPGFICTAGAVSAVLYNKTLAAPQDLTFISHGLRYLDLSGVQVPDFFRTYPGGHFSHLITLNLSGCGISNITAGKGYLTSHYLTMPKGINDFGMVQILDLSHNKLSRLHDDQLALAMPRLNVLDLSHNRELTHISKLTFWLLPFLKTIDLSFTGISELHKSSFSLSFDLQVLILKQTTISKVNFYLPLNLEYLNIEQTNITTVEKGVFNDVKTTIREIRSSSYKLCCPQVLGPRIPDHVCHFTGKTGSSCSDLIRERALRLLLWLVGIASLVGNILTLLYRITWDRNLLLKPYGLFVTNLGASDILMGCYLLMIIIADVSYLGEYVFHDHSWRNSHVCKAAGILATLSSITSALFIFLITVDRYLVVRFPYGEVRFTGQTMAIAVVVVWLFGVFLSILPVMPFARAWVVFSQNGMCLGLPLTNERLPGWQYSSFLFVGLNLVLFVFIGIGQVVIYKDIREKGKKTRRYLNSESQLHRNHRAQEITIAKQLSLIVLSNFVCWFPIITMGLITLFGTDVGEAAYRWCAILILPINSALNPVLYTLPAVKEKLEDFREECARQKAPFQKAKKTPISACGNKFSLRKYVKTFNKTSRVLTSIKLTESIPLAKSELANVYGRVIGIRTAIKGT